jgi:hypothetical protein
MANSQLAFSPSPMLPGVRQVWSQEGRHGQSSSNLRSPSDSTMPTRPGSLCIPQRNDTLKDRISPTVESRLEDSSHGGTAQQQWWAQPSSALTRQPRKGGASRH